ncbi:MAG: heme/hemin ABC transporter substrate-binding protein [Micrococcaceae bacterium]
MTAAPSTQPRRRPAVVISALLAALSLLLLTACGGAGAATKTAGQTLASAEFLENPKDFEGPSTASLADSSLRPVANNPSPELPATVVDSQDTTVTVTDVSRILALDLYGTASRTVYELGLGDNIVGRDTSSGFPEIIDKPLVTQNGHNLNAEAILELAPTLIITDSSLGPWDVILQMRDAGIPVVVIDSKRDIDNVGDLTRQIASAIGLPEQGEELANRIDAEVDEMIERIQEYVPENEDEKLRMMFLYVRGQAGIYYIFGPGSGTDSLIDGLGGIDVAAEIGWEGMMPMTDEAIVEAQPDLVLMMTKGLESVNGVDGLMEAVPPLAHTPAGEKSRIVDMSDYEVLSFGPNTPGVLEALAVAVYAPNTSAELEDQR